MYLFQRIEEVMIQYHDARAVIAEFLLNEKNHLYRYTMDDIARFTYTSKSTLVRFAKTLGFKGWKDFNRVLMEEIKYQESNKSTIDVNFPFVESDDYKKVIDNMAQLQIESIMDTANLIQEKMLELAVIRLSKAKNIILFGMRPNSYYAESLRWKFLSIGLHIHIAGYGEFGMLARTLTKDDCAILVSYSGDNVNKDPMAQVEILKKQNVPMIAMTSGGNNYLQQNIDCIFEISARERLYSKISTFATEQSLLLIFSVIFACYFKKHYNQNLVYKIENSKVLEQQRNATLKQLKEE